MRNNLVNALLNKDKTIRETLDEFTQVKQVNEGPLSDLADALETDDAGSDNQEEASSDDNQEAQLVANDDDFPVKMLFVRRFHSGDEKPAKRVKCANISEALKVFFEWVLKYKNDQIEIWTSNATDAKNFYRFVLKNRSAIEPLWKSNIRTKNLMQWPAAYRDIQQRSRQSGSNLTGTLEPFNVPAK